MAPSSPPSSSRIVPSYAIDLASPPHLRYAKVAQDFGQRMRSLEYLFDEVLDILFAAAILRKSVKFLARKALHRLHDDEETKEIRGIARIAGMDPYLLVAFNTLLDSMLGCTSGAVRVKPTREVFRGDGGSPPNAVRLMHFRTLDWGMDRLRDLLVVLEFVDSSSETPGRVIARSITYAGFVGTLTAVR